MANHYSKRERLAYAWDWLRWKLGLFRRFEEVEYSQVRRVVFVCKGNICRSAYAEARLRQMGYDSASFGVDAVDGRAADPDAVRLANERGVILTSHLTTSFNGHIIQEGDVFACMEPKHAIALFEKGFSVGSLNVLLLATLDNKPSIVDPYGKTDQEFVIAFNTIDRALAVLVDRLDKMVKQR